MTMKGTTWLIVAAGMLALGGCGGGGGGGGGTPADFSGLWTINETMGPNTCGDPTGPQPAYKVRVDQASGSSSAEVSVVDDTNTIVLDGPFLATVDGSTASWTGSFAEAGGTTTAQITATMTGANSLSGSSNWSWTDGVDSCSGTTSFTGTR